MRRETVEGFLGQLAARVPAPGGGATAALHAAQSAALTARVNIEVNLRGINDAAIRAGLGGADAVTDEIIARADRIVAAVRDEISE